MLISVKHHFVLLSMPKCASTSLDSAVQEYSDIIVGGVFKHSTFRTYALHYLPMIRARANGKHIPTLCVVREPIEWLGSWYRYRSRKELRNPKHPRHASSTAHVTFDNFVEAYLAERQPAYAKVGSQYAFVSDKTGKIGVDRLFSLENLGKLVEYLEKQIGRKLEIETHNVSPSKTIALRGDLRRRLELACPKEFELYAGALRGGFDL